MPDPLPLWTVAMVGGVALLEYDNPPLNYLTATGLYQFGRALDDARRAGAVALVITGGVPDLFITHYSVEEILAGQDKIQERGPLGNQRAQQLLERLADLPQPVIAALSGDTMGFGYELALACDFRIAQRGDFRIGLPEVRMGIIPGAGGTQRLARLVGTARALDLIMRARVVSPEEAFDYGLVHELADDARATAMDLARELAALPPTAVAMAKAAVYGGQDLDLHAAERVERDASYRAKIAPGTTEVLTEYVALPLEQRRNWIDRRP
ncbi:enoyl-CoA hydratase-related protein [Acidothermaceae bacterium B102]|nr:enoyl-CoA hydratase-related protein [Acidothermaceae bacterium B102]